MLESLIDAGTFDEFGLNRATLKANLVKITEYAHLKNMIGIDEPPILEIIKENKNCPIVTRASTTRKR